VTHEEFRARLLSRTEVAGVQVSPVLFEKLEAYFQLLTSWNRRINLTALDLESLPAAAVDRLLVEPLAAARFAPRHEAVLDVGSGGGSPAIPFALATDAKELTMVESRARKSVFLREAARTVELTDVRVMTGRIADIANSRELAARFAVVTVRAVRLEEADWAGLVNALKPGGSIFLLHRTDENTQDLPFTRETHPLIGDSSVSIWTIPAQ
jgi:16S rRNA (guanine527-N7)-methyltransferase